jgi:D-aminopeptidase
MPRSSRPDLNAAQKQEIISLYRDESVPISEILNTYSLLTSRLYAILKSAHVPTRSKLRVANAETALAELPVATPLRVQTDANGFVQNIERKPAVGKLYTWEVRFESAMRVEAATITEAIEEVAKLPMCRRVFNVALKGAP